MGESVSSMPIEDGSDGTHRLQGEHTGAVLGDASKGAGGHVLDEREVGRERLIAIWIDAVSAGPEVFVEMFHESPPRTRNPPHR